MPVLRCPNGKFRIGSGPCQYPTRAAAEKAYKGYLASKSKTTKIEGRIQEMAEAEAMELIPKVIYDRIKTSDPTPQFRVFSFGHEGFSTGETILSKGKQLLGRVKLIKRWLKQTIQEMTEKVKIGSKALHLHTNVDNSTENRTTLGEIVGKGLKTIKNLLHSIGVVYIYPEYKDWPLDICSVEGEIDFTTREGAEGHIYADDINVKSISAITLGNSAVNKPGFAGATLQALIQELAQEGEPDPPDGGQKVTITLSDIKKFIADEGLTPSEVFQIEQLHKDSAVIGLVKEATANAYGKQKRMEGKKEQEFETLKKENQTLKDKNAESDRTIAKVDADKLMVAAIKERKLTETQTAWVKRDFTKKFKVKDPEKTGDELKEFLDDSLTELDENQKLLGIKTEEKKDLPGGDITAGAEKKRVPPQSDEVPEYEDPLKNPHIPQ